MHYFRINPACHIDETSDLFVVLSDDCLRIPKRNHRVIKIIHLLSNSCGASVQKLCELSNAATLELVLSHLREHGMLQWSSGPFNAYSSTLDVYFSESEGENFLSRCTWIIVGTGGVGAEIAIHIGLNGGTKIVLIDGDTVSESNFNRQYHFERTQIGGDKVSALKKRLLDLNPTLSIQVHKCYVGYHCDSDPIFQLYSNDDRVIVMSCADTPREIHKYCFSQCEKLGFGFMAAAVGLRAGMWGPYYSPGTVSSQPLHDAWRCTHPTSATRLSHSFGPTNSLLAARAAYDAISAACGDMPLCTEKLCILNFHTMELTQC